MKAVDILDDPGTVYASLAHRADYENTIMVYMNRDQ